MVGAGPERGPPHHIHRDAYLPRLPDGGRQHVGVVRRTPVALAGGRLDDELAVVVVGTDELMAGGALVPAPREPHLVDPAVVLGGEHLPALADELRGPPSCRVAPLPSWCPYSLISLYPGECGSWYGDAMGMSLREGRHVPWGGVCPCPLAGARSRSSST